MLLLRSSAATKQFLCHLTNDWGSVALSDAPVHHSSKEASKMKHFGTVLSKTSSRRDNCRLIEWAEPIHPLHRSYWLLWHNGQSLAYMIGQGVYDGLRSCAGSQN